MRIPTSVVLRVPQLMMREVVRAKTVAYSGPRRRQDYFTFDINGKSFECEYVRTDEEPILQVYDAST